MKLLRHLLLNNVGQWLLVCSEVPVDIPVINNLVVCLVISLELNDKFVQMSSGIMLDTQVKLFTKEGSTTLHSVS